MREDCGVGAIAPAKRQLEVAAGEGRFVDDVTNEATVNCQSAVKSRMTLPPRPACIAASTMADGG